MQENNIRFLWMGNEPDPAINYWPSFILWEVNLTPLPPERPPRRGIQLDASFFFTKLWKNTPQFRIETQAEKIKRASPSSQ